MEQEKRLREELKKQLEEERKEREAESKRRREEEVKLRAELDKLLNERKQQEAKVQGLENAVKKLSNKGMHYRIDHFSQRSCTTAYPLFGVIQNFETLFVFSLQSAFLFDIIRQELILLTGSYGFNSFCHV